MGTALEQTYHTCPARSGRVESEAGAGAPESQSSWGQSWYIRPCGALCCTKVSHLLTKHCVPVQYTILVEFDDYQVSSPREGASEATLEVPGESRIPSADRPLKSHPYKYNHTYS